MEIFPTRRHIVRGAALAVLLLLVSVTSYRLVKQARTVEAQAAKLKHPVELGRVTFAAAGDVIPHQAVRAAAETHGDMTPPAKSVTRKEDDTANVASEATASQGNDHAGWDYLFSAVADVFRSADFGFVNLETPIAPVKGHAGKPFLFNAPAALLDALDASGIKIVSFANNHVMDQGYVGLGETLEQIHSHGLAAAGAGLTAADSWKPVVLEKNGIKVGWLGMTRWLNGGRNPEKDSDPHVAFLPYPGESGGATDAMKPVCSKQSKPRVPSATCSSFPFIGESNTRRRRVPKTLTSRTRCSKPEPAPSSAIIRTCSNRWKPIAPPTSATP